MNAKRTSIMEMVIPFIIFLVGMMSVMAISSQTAYADTDTSTGGNNGGGGSVKIVSYWIKVISSNGGTAETDVINKLEGQKGGNFKCSNSNGTSSTGTRYAWAVYFIDANGNSGYLFNKNGSNYQISDMNASRNPTNWSPGEAKGTIGGGSRSLRTLWKKYISEANNNDDYPNPSHSYVNIPKGNYHYTDLSLRGHPGSDVWSAGCVMLPQSTYGSYTDTETRADLAAHTTSTTSDIQTCYIDYDNSVIGLDGYVKGMSYDTEDNPSDGALSSDKRTVITPYGQLYNNLLTASKNKTGTWYKYTTTPSSATEATTLRQELISQANFACDKTSKTKTSITVDKASNITKAFAKGGILEVKKQGTKQTLTYPTTDTLYYIRTHEYHRTVYVDCKTATGKTITTTDGNEKTIGCKAGKKSDHSNTSWAASTESSDIGNWDSYHLVKGTRNKSTITNYKGKSWNMGSPYCTNGTSRDGTKTSYSNYENGCWTQVNGKISVGFSKNSKTHIYHYDILNILCDKKDFELYRSWAKSSSGFSNVDDSVSTSSSRRYQATLVSSKSNNPNATFQPVSKTLFSMNKLGGWNNTKMSDKNKMTALLTSYNAANDPVYTKECPFDCTASTTGDAASANGASSNVGKTNASSSTRSGVKVNASDGTGSMSASSSNSADMTFFRDNTWNNLTTDVWYPSTEESISYTGSKAKRTIISRWADGTPKGTNGAELQAKQGSSWSDVFTSSTGGSIGSQTSPATASTGVYSSGLISVLSGQVSSFRIRAPWASTANKPLKYSIKWEYDVSNTVPVITGMSSTGDDGSASTVMGTTATTSDGKCSAYYDGSSSRNGDTDSVSTNTGSGTTYTLANFDNDDMSRAFTILFVRSTTD